MLYFNQYYLKVYRYTLRYFIENEILMKEKNNADPIRKCSITSILAVNDTMSVLNGKWKLSIITSLSFGKKRFKEIERDLSKITPRMLSKELKDLEANGILTRKVYHTVPMTVEYELTASGQSFSTVLDAMIICGIQHRENVLG